MIDQRQLLELMSSRMFHDLAGPIGAVSNSIEFLDDDNSVIREKALNIIKSSADESIARLKFFRQAYGTVGDQEVYLSTYAPLVEDFVANSKVKIEWQTQEYAVPSYIAKTVLNLIIIAMGSLIYGGVVTITQSDLGINLMIVGRETILNQETKDLLQGETDKITLTSANIQALYTHIMMKEAETNLQISKHDYGLEFYIPYKAP